VGSGAIKGFIGGCCRGRGRGGQQGVIVSRVRRKVVRQCCGQQGVSSGRQGRLEGPYGGFRGAVRMAEGGQGVIRTSVRRMCGTAAGGPG
jgi:hypothetical protein